MRQMRDRAQADLGKVEFGVRRIGAHVRGDARAAFARQRGRLAPQIVGRGIVADQRGPGGQQRIAGAG
ncbi:MAG: hypothetical protein QM744_02505 [Mesorhizobium sp.]